MHKCDRMCLTNCSRFVGFFSLCTENCCITMSPNTLISTYNKPSPVVEHKQGTDKEKQILLAFFLSVHPASAFGKSPVDTKQR